MNGCKKRRIFLVLALVWLSPQGALAEWSTIAFNYAKHPPLQALQSYDVVVIDPEADVTPKDFRPDQSILAYVSLGETAVNAPYRSKLATDWILGENKSWQSLIMNEANPAWRRFFVDQLITPLWQRGYHGFFIDTVDAYNRFSHQPRLREAQMQGVISLLQAIHEKYPGAILILNRGFEILPKVAKNIQGVATESLFSRFNQTTASYETVPDADRSYQVKELNRAKSLGLKAIVIDYLPVSQSKKASQIKTAIKQLGFIPYVTDGLLQEVPQAEHAIQRRVLMLYSKNNNETIFNPDAFTLLGMPLEHLGYLPVYLNVKDPLPKHMDASDYAGIVVWTNPLTDEKDQALYQFLVKAKQAGIKIAFFSSFGFKPTPDRLSSFDLFIQEEDDRETNQFKIVEADKQFIGFEIKPHVNNFDYDLYQAKNARVLLKLEGKHQTTEDAIAITDFGGYALDPYITSTTPKGLSLWVINPFDFLEASLRLATFPVPDVTTENGVRLAFIHIDGDGFTNRAWWKQNKIAADILLHEILEVYPFPTTFSIVTAYFTQDGVDSENREASTKIARQILALPWVHAASHTFSHPFDWVKIKTINKNGIYNLPVKNYRFNNASEITGSIDYINQHLLPENKKARLLLWSGLANAGPEAFSILEEAQLLNLNGGNTEINDSAPYLSLVSPMGRTVGAGYQVFAPIANEEYYTNNFSNPLYGFEHVIQTFKRTNEPRRLKPVDIYYHIYSTAQEASFTALVRVYEWAKSQNLNWITAENYARKVLDANRTQISRRDEGFDIENNGEVKELRLPATSGYPDLSKSKNIVGYRITGKTLYIHLGTDKASTLFLAKDEGDLPYLLSANGRLIHFTRRKNGFDFRVIGYQPLIITLGNASRCELSDQSAQFFKKLNEKTIINNAKTYVFNDKDSHDLSLLCKA